MFDPSLSQRVVLIHFSQSLIALDGQTALATMNGIDQFNDGVELDDVFFFRLPYFQLSGSALTQWGELFDIHAELG